MKAISTLLALLGFVATAPAQTTMNFPLGVSPDSINYVGYAFVNPNAADVTLALTAYCSRAGGETVQPGHPTCDQGVVNDSATIIVPARGQVARLFSQLFPGSTQGGWVHAETDASGLVGFLVVGDFPLCQHR